MISEKYLSLFDSTSEAAGPNAFSFQIYVMHSMIQRKYKFRGQVIIRSRVLAYFNGTNYQQPNTTVCVYKCSKYAVANILSNMCLNDAQHCALRPIQ